MLIDLILLDRLFIENVLSSEFDDDGDVQRQANEHVQHSAHRSDEQVVVLLKPVIVNHFIGQTNQDITVSVFITRSVYKSPQVPVMGFTLTNM